MEPTGDRLRRAREAKRLSLRDVAAATKISASALEALERNDFSRVPGGIYGRSFVRAYAELVDLPGDEIVEAFGAELAQHQRDRARKQVRPSVTPGDREFLARQERALKLLRAAVVAMLLIVVVGVVWYGWRWLGRGETASVTPADAIPSTTGPAGSDGRSFTPQAPPPAAAIPPLAPVQTVPSAGERIVVEVRPSGECWVSVLADGQVMLDRVLKAGESQRFTAERELTLDVGNAGVLEWSLNGRAARLLGERGQHRRASITPENVSTFWE